MNRRGFFAFVVGLFGARKLPVLVAGTPLPPPPIILIPDPFQFPFEELGPQLMVELSLDEFRALYFGSPVEVMCRESSRDFCDFLMPLPKRIYMKTERFADNYIRPAVEVAGRKWELEHLARLNELDLDT